MTRYSCACHNATPQRRTVVYRGSFTRAYAGILKRRRGREESSTRTEEREKNPRDTYRQNRSAALRREVDESFPDASKLIYGQLYDLASFIDKDGRERVPWMYAKLLPHDEHTLSPLLSDVYKLVNVIERPSRGGLQALPLAPGAQRLHADVLGGHGIETQSVSPLGGIFSKYCLSSFVPARSKLGFSELLEVYALALARDIPFDEWNTSPVIEAIKDSLNKARHNFGSTYPEATTQNLFRGKSGDETLGGIISQLLLHDIKAGALQVQQVYEKESDALKNRNKSGYLNMMHGAHEEENTRSGQRLRVCNLRVLGSLVHRDPAYYIYINAALILLEAGFDGFDAKNIASSNFVNTGAPDLLSILGSVCRASLRSAWTVKWGAVCKVRPETYAGHLNNAISMSPQDSSNIPGYSDLREWSKAEFQTSQILDKIKQQNLDQVGEANLHLPLMYSEGSPTHPSYPAGHAVLAGACCTVLKAMIKTHNGTTKRLWKDVYGLDGTLACNPQAPSETVSVSATGETITGEINKLASNIAIGRNAAGVHYRSDADCGLYIGERIAEEYLITQVRYYYPEAIRSDISFTFERFNGELVSIDASGIVGKGF